jgi:hypothetical protein
MIALIQHNVPEILVPKNGKPCLPIRSVRRFLQYQLNWTVRVATKASQKLPDNWQDQCKKPFFDLLVYTINREHIHQSLVINADQTAVVLIPGANQRTYNEKGVKQVSLLGLEEKRALTVLLATSADGKVLPAQEVWFGKTVASLPTPTARAESESEGFLFSTNPKNHWSNEATMYDFFLKLYGPYRSAMIQEHHLPIDSKVLVYLDCWSVHRSTNMLHWYKSVSWLIIIFVPGGCTPVFQPCDVGLQRMFKRHIRIAASSYFVEEVRNKLAMAFNQEISAWILQLVHCGTKQHTGYLRRFDTSIRTESLC